MKKVFALALTALSFAAVAGCANNKELDKNANKVYDKIELTDGMTAALGDGTASEGKTSLKEFKKSFDKTTTKKAGKDVYITYGEPKGGKDRIVAVETDSKAGDAGIFARVVLGLNPDNKEMTKKSLDKLRGEPVSKAIKKFGQPSIKMRADVMGSPVKAYGWPSKDGFVLGEYIHGDLLDSNVLKTDGHNLDVQSLFNEK